MTIRRSLFIVTLIFFLGVAVAATVVIYNFANLLAPPQPTSPTQAPSESHTATSPNAQP